MRARIQKRYPGNNFFSREGWVGGVQGLFSGILILIRINSNFMIFLLKVTCIYYPISYIFDVMHFKFRLKLLVQMIFFSQSRLYFMIKQFFSNDNHWGWNTNYNHHIYLEYLSYRNKLLFGKKKCPLFNRYFKTWILSCIFSQSFCS